MAGTLSHKCCTVYFRYDPKTDQWTIIAPISSPRDAVGVCVLGDKLYAVGGYDGQQYLNDVECYEALTNEWTKVTFHRLFFIIIQHNRDMESVPIG